MGYQVGNTCYATKQDADNVYFSLVAPVIISQKAPTVATYPPVKFLKGCRQSNLYKMVELS